MDTHTLKSNTLQRKTHTNPLGDKRWDCENYYWDPSPAQQPQLEINNNLLATLYLFLSSLKRKYGWIKCVCGLGSWLRTGAVTVTWKWWKPRAHESVWVKCAQQQLLIVDHNSLGACRASPSQQSTGVCTDLWAANFCQHQHALNNRTETTDRWLSGETEVEKDREIHSVGVHFNLQQIPAVTQCESCDVAQSPWETRSLFCCRCQPSPSLLALHSSTLHWPFLQLQGWNSRIYSHPTDRGNESNHDCSEASPWCC